MSTDAKPSNNPRGHDGFEHEDLSASGVLYFIVGVAALVLVGLLAIVGFYKLLDERAGKEQPAVSPLATNVPKDTRDLPEGYKNPGGYQKYLKDAFPAPRLEIDERTELNDDRIAEEAKLNSYGYVDDNHVTVRIPIERAMDLLAQRGLPVRSQNAAPDAEKQNAAQPKAKAKTKKGSSR